MDYPQINYENNGVFFPGQSVRGQIVLELSEPMKARFLKIIIDGKAHTYWTESERRTHVGSNGNTRHTETIHYSSYINYVSGETIVWSCDQGSNCLVPGRHVFPFEIQLPANCPPSFEGSYGSIRYTVKAEIERPWKFNRKNKKPFTVVVPFDLNAIPLAINPASKTVSKSVGFYKKGYVTMTACLPKTGFVPGENVSIDVMVDNQSRNDIIAVKAKMLQIANYTAQRNGQQIYVNMTSYGVFHTERRREETKQVTESRTNTSISPHSKQNINFLLKIPSIVSSFNNCPIISAEYILTVKLVSSATFGINLHADFPIIIGTIPIQTQPVSTQAVPVPAPRTQVVQPSAPPMESRESSLSANPPVYNALFNAPPPSYEESVYGKTGTTSQTEDMQSFAPMYPVYNNLPTYTAQIKK